MPKQDMDIIAEFPGLVVIHQKIPAREVGRHTHEEHEFFMPLQGEIAVHHGERTVNAGAGRMLYVRPDLDHSFTSTAQGSGERVIWLIEDKLWKKHSDLNFEPTPLPSNSLAKEILFYLLIHQKAEGSKYFVAALIETLIESLKGAQLNEAQIFTDHIGGKVKDERIRTAIQILEQRMESITVSELARESGLSQRNFSRLFMQETSLSPKDYLILCRVNKAKKLLKESRLTVTDIALEVGYNSLSKFIETFRKITGTLPTDYRR